MASGALQRIDQIQSASTQAEYGKLSSRFVDELKGSTLFQHNWGELLGAAPTALSLMGSCWLAASNATAEKISLADSKPVGGFKYMTDVPSPTLRSCLVDGNVQQRRAHAFTVAGQNMDALQLTSKRIGDERIPMVFRRLGPCTLGEDQYEDFKDALDDFASDARTCAKLATDIREAFGKWGKMVGELHAVTENQKGLTAINAERTRIDGAVTKIEETHAGLAIEDVKKQVTRAAKNVDKQQKNLDTMIDKVPGPWATVLQTAVSSFAQALPSIMSTAIMVKNPAAITAGVAAGQAGATASSTATSGTAQPNAQTTPSAADPAYALAATIQNLVNHFYECLGGEKADDEDDAPQGLAYILGIVKGQKANIDVTCTAPNKKLLAAYDALIKLAGELQAHLRKQNELSAAKDPAEDVVKRWKASATKARDDILELAASAKSAGSSNVPMPFGNVQIPPPDLSAQTAQLNTAMQGVQIAQLALDNAETAYQNAVDKQKRMAKAMATIQAKLQKLASTGKTLDEIKSRFFIMLTTVIDVLVMPRANDFEKLLGKTAKRTLRSGVLRADEVDKTAIYTSTLQLKAYFSLLQDIATMYSIVHRDHIIGGVELCYELSKGTSRNDGMPELQEKLAKYTDNASKKVAAIVSAKQQEILRTLRARAKRAHEETCQIEAVIAEYKVTVVDVSATRAIEAGAQEQRAAAEVLLKSEVSVTAARFTWAEYVDASDM
ncbi:hypothetical protein C8A01DRAFT_38092 [Parachaetomium inaequale]|uniref:Uncharacterized protein n=1 Tax=Parachaetomium inaequale TaxID=2588326 RepID=A0AAN6PCC2_9PEZI|nr:hypothetical protein C8A01DRAFT_38092 [Parachaetomium inaequale]